MTDEPTTAFTITGTTAGHPATIAWTAKTGFDDPLGLTAAMIAEGRQVCGTVTGPCWPAAAKPAVVAWITAKQALDEIEGWDVGGDQLEAELVALAEVPVGATP